MNAKKQTKPGKIKQEGDRVWIDSIQPWGDDEMTNSVIASMAVAMQSVGEPISYEYLMGVSGSAFRLQVAKDWCPSSPNSFCGLQTVDGAVKALPYKEVGYKLYHESKPVDKETWAKTRNAVKSSIDSGIPVQYGGEEDGLIVGYTKGGEQWLCVHPLHSPRECFVVMPTANQTHERQAWGVAVFTEKKESMPAPKQFVRESLELAVKLAETEEVEGYACGFNAWNQWIAALKDDMLLKRINPASLHTRQLGNAWIYHCLVDARRAAGRYLRESRDLFGGAVAAHLNQAADAYEAMVNILANKRPAEIAPYPGPPTKGKQWTGEMRGAQAQILAEALVYERRAIEKIATALEILNPFQPPPLLEVKGKN